MSDDETTPAPRVVYSIACLLFEDGHLEVKGEDVPAEMGYDILRRACDTAWKQVVVAHVAQALRGPNGKRVLSLEEIRKRNRPHR